MKKVINTDQYLKYLPLSGFFTTKRTREILSVNPTTEKERKEADKTEITIFNYSTEQLEEKRAISIDNIGEWENKTGITWINIDGLKKTEVEKTCS